MKRLTTVAGVAFAVLAGCGSSNNGSSSNNSTTPPTLDAFCTSVVNALSTRAVACEGGPVDGFTLLFSGEGARSMCNEWKRGVAANRIRFDPNQAQSCLDALANLDCAVLGAGTEPPECRPAIAGLVAIGGSCFSDPECANDGICNLSQGCPGTCIALIAANAACSLTGPGCVAGATCVNGTCRLDTDINQPCGGTNPACRSGLVCLAQTSGAQTGLCQSRQTSGACTSSEQCAAGFVCVNQSGSAQCVRAKTRGSACTVGAGECELFTSCVSGTCQLFPKTGETCNPPGAGGESTFCLQGLCDPNTSTCVALGAAGSACQFDAECDSGICTNGACASVCQ